MFQWSSIPRFIAHQSICLALEYVETSVVRSFILSGHQVTCNSSSSSFTPLQVHWIPRNTLKVNFDSSLKGNLGASKFVITDHFGWLLYAGSRHLLVASVPMTEIRAAWEGFTIVLYTLQCKRLLLGGDSNVVINWINGNTSYRTSHCILLGILHLSEPFDFLWYQSCFQRS